MQFPDFFAQVPRLRLQDPLADFLGASSGGVLEYGYEDAVKLAGHSCPTVASAYALGCKAMAALYPDGLPERGRVRVELAEGRDEGVTGVIASVLSLLTGAAQEGGFKGIGGNFGRRNLLHFAAPIPLSLRVVRLDSGAAVDGEADLSRVPAVPEMSLLLGRCLGGEADAGERQRFAALWQERVERILCRHWDDDRVFLVRPV